MKIDVQYLNDSKGVTTAVQLPVAEWNKLMARIKKYEQTLKLKSELTAAFAEVEKLRKSKSGKQTLSEFLHEL